MKPNKDMPNIESDLLPMKQSSVEIATLPRIEPIMRPAMKAIRLLALALLSTLTCALRAADNAPAAIPFSELGAKATADYKGEAIGIEATADGGARLHTAFQKLTGTVTPEGLWLESTEAEGGRLRLIATAIGRGNSQLSTFNFQLLPSTGTVVAGEKTVAFVRPGLTEEYSVSVDGVRQDFVIAERPAGAGELRVELSLSGARAEVAANGVKLTLDGSGRELAYGRLRVVDATGRELSASLEVLATDRLAVRVDDATAAYPVRIDPTFSDADWVSLNPSIPGADGSVYAIAKDGSGNVYIGGSFEIIGTVAAYCIAKWNGNTWSILGSGMNGEVYALAISGSDLYAGGNFTTAGGVSANRIAKWNGSAWSALGSGMNNNSRITALAVSGTDLYAGGTFTRAGGVLANRIAKWNGSAWSTLGSGVDNPVYSLAVSGSDLYAGGAFTTAGGVTANYIAKWNGSVWSALGAGMNYAGYVTALTVSGTNLYAGGSFGTAGEVSTNAIAKWNGSEWSALGSGMDGSVSALAVNGNDLYAGGVFTRAGGVPAKYVAKWNGSAWSALGSGISSGTDIYVTALAVSGSDLYTGGYFTAAGEVSVNSIAKWSGIAWSALGSGMNYGSTVTALAVSGSDLYVGGTFTRAGEVSANHIAKWNGSTWSALGSGMNNGTVNALAVSGSDLYAGGYFYVAGGVDAYFIAKWDGIAWSALGSGMNNPVYSLAFSGSDLYAGGAFTTAGGVAANYIAKWNGSDWSALGFGMSVGPFLSVNALAVSDGDLYAGGRFTTAGGVSANHIAKWNGSEWSALGSGIGSGPSVYVSALAVSGSDLYAGGYFYTAGGAGIGFGIAKWNGSAWSALGSGMDERVNALAVSGSDLYAGGRFTTAGGVLAPQVAKWDGSAWSTLGSGVYFNSVYALATDASSHLFVGGDFTFTGTTLSPYIAQANLDPSTTRTPTLTAPATNAVTGSPVSVAFILPEAAQAGSVALSFGATVVTLANSQATAGAHSFTFNPANPTAGPEIASGSAIPNGTYTVTLSYQDALGNAAATASSTNVTIGTLTPLQSWKLTHLGNANAPDLGDPDHDGLLTLAEYGLNLLPETPSQPPGASIFTYAEGKRLRMLVPRDPAHNDITVEVQATGNLVSGPWTTIATSTLGTPFTGPGYVGGDNATPGVKTVEIRDTVNISAATQRWLRVKVTH